jgi:hypothetical protein
MTRSMDRSWLTVSRVGVGALIAAALLTVVPFLAPDARAAGQPWSSTTSAFVTCVVDSTPQRCDPAHVQKVLVPNGKKIRVAKLRYTAATTHCSSGRLLIKLDGETIGRTDWVDAGEKSEVELLDVTLHRRPGGKPHKFTYKMQGKLGGCNSGAVGSWAGDIKLSGNKKPA